MPTTKRRRRGSSGKALGSPSLRRRRSHPHSSSKMTAAPRDYSHASIESQPPFHQFSRLPLEIQIEILRFAATPIQKPTATYQTKNHPSAYKYRITSYYPPPAGRPQLNAQCLSELASYDARRMRKWWTFHQSLNLSILKHKGGGKNAPLADLAVVGGILSFNSWLNSKESVEWYYSGARIDRVKDVVRLEICEGLFWTNRLGRQISLGIWKEMVGRVEVPEPVRGVESLAGGTKREVLRQLDGLIAQMKDGTA